MHWVSRCVAAQEMPRRRSQSFVAQGVFEYAAQGLAKCFHTTGATRLAILSTCYAINQWDALNRYVEDGRLPIDNGPVERAITSVAIGRKNYLFVGFQAGGERAAIIYTVLGSCKLLGLDPNAYLRDVFDKLANGWKSSQLEELLPKQWLASRDPPVKLAA